MAVFQYKGVDSSGKNIKGVLDSDSPRMLRTQLRKKGIFLTQYSESSGGGASAVRRGNTMAAEGSREVEISKAFQRIQLMEVAILTRQMSTLIRAGIPVVDSLNACVDQTENPKLKTVLTNIKQVVNEGSSLGDALDAHPKVFNRLYVNMVRAGESSGTLDIIFGRLADFIEGQVKLKNKLFGALMYPAIMLVIAFLIISLMMIFVVPKITEMFAEMGAELPLVTRILIGTSDVFRSYWWLGMLGGGISFWRFNIWKDTEKGRAKVDRWKLQAPIFGSLIRMVAVTRFTTTFETLLSSGVPILTALDIVKNVVNNTVLEAVIDEARLAIQEGEGIAIPLARSKEFPSMMTHMIAIGEKTGQLEEMLKNVADAYKTQVEGRVTALTSVLEPIMIVVMGIGVGFLVFAILMPMLQMNDAIMGG